MNAYTAHAQYLHALTLSLVMKPNPLFLLGLTLVTLGGPAAAQTTPPSAPKNSAGKGVSHPKRAAAPPRTASGWAVKIDTAVFRYSGRPADAIRTSVRDLPQSMPSRN